MKSKIWGKTMILKKISKERINIHSIFVLGFIALFICMSIYSLNMHFKLQEAKRLTVHWYNKANDKSKYQELEKENKELKHDIQEMKKLNKIINDLKKVPRDLRELTLANCYNETNLNYNAIHKGKNDIGTTGICGVKEFWIDVIPELSDKNINSLYAGSLVLQYLMEKHENKYDALKKYKGAKKNLKPVYHTLSLKEVIKQHK